MRKEAAADGVGGDNIDILVASVFVVCAFVEDLFKFCGVAPGAPAGVVFGSLWVDVTFSEAGDSGGELGMEVTKLVKGNPLVLGGNNSCLVDIGFVTVLFGWDSFESVVSNTGGCWDLNEGIPLLWDVTVGTPKLPFGKLWTDDGGVEFSVTLNLGRLLDMDVTTAEDIVVGTGAVQQAGLF